MFVTTKLVVLAFVSIALIGTGPHSPAAPATPAINPDLAMLGDGVVSSLGGTNPIVDAAAAFTPHSGIWTYQILGTRSGSIDTESLASVTSNGQSVWRRSGAPGHETDFVITADGVFKTRMTDPDHKLVFEYTPGEPELLNGMAPGDKRQSTYAVRASDPAAPAVTKASGQMSVEFTYLGLNQIKTVAGVFDAHGFSKVLTGKIGPTIIDTTLYVFYVAGTGQIARVDHTDVRALLLYNRDTRAGYLLEQPPKFSSP